MWHANDKKSAGRNSPADYEGKRCSAVSYSTGKLGEGSSAMDGGAFLRGRPLKPFEDRLLTA